MSTLPLPHPGAFELALAGTDRFLACQVNPAACGSQLGRWLASSVRGRLDKNNPHATVVLVSGRKIAEVVLGQVLAAEQLSVFNALSPGRYAVPDSPAIAAAALRRAASQLEARTLGWAPGQWQGHVRGQLVWPQLGAVTEPETFRLAAYFDACAWALQYEGYVVAAAGSPATRPPPAVSAQTLFGAERAEHMIEEFWAAGPVAAEVPEPVVLLSFPL